MKRRGRAVVISVLVLVVGALAVTDLNAICGVPGIVTASTFAGGTGTVILYNPVAPFNFTGMASVAFGGAAAERQYELWRNALLSVPTNYLSIVAPSPPAAPACQICNMVGGPFPNCAGPTITMIYD